jgi:hypothetical protein
MAKLIKTRIEPITCPHCEDKPISCGERCTQRSRVRYAASKPKRANCIIPTRCRNNAAKKAQVVILKSETYHFHRLDLTRQTGFIVTVYDEDGLKLATTMPASTPAEAFREARKIVDNKVEGPHRPR